MDFHKLTTRYRQFGGIRLVREYAKMGVLPTIINGFFRCLVKRQSFKGIYPNVLHKIEPFLIAKYGGIKVNSESLKAKSRFVHEHPKLIWWCWLQGFDVAPTIVKACYNSLKRQLSNYEIRIINAENWKQYIELPDYIVNKWKRGMIPAASFSDLLRLQLLIEHGGTWIDSTVLCTGIEYAKIFLEADLFVFQYTMPGDKWSGNVSTWFISAHSNNEILKTVRDMLFAYWKDFDCLLDYYMIHLFFKVVTENYPEKIDAMPYGYSMRSLTLLHHWDETFDQKKWDKLTSRVNFHKLAFRVDQKTKDNRSNFYNYILNTNKEVGNGRL